MNDHDWNIIQRGLESKEISPLEKVRQKRKFKKRMEELSKDKFDWFLKKEMGEFYNYDPRND